MMMLDGLLLVRSLSVALMLVWRVSPVIDSWLVLWEVVRGSCWYRDGVEVIRIVIYGVMQDASGVGFVFVALQTGLSRIWFYSRM